MTVLEKRTKEILGNGQPAALATVTPDGKPWVRTITLIPGSGLTILFCTDAGSRKIRDIRQNPEVHLTCGDFNPPDDSVYLQIQGRAVVSDDAQVKTDHWRDAWLRYFTGPEDPHYVIVKIHPYRIEYNAPGLREPQVWESGLEVQ
jgi:general stress protein 26